MKLKIHHLPTGRCLTRPFLDRLHAAVREEQDAGFQVWLSGGRGPALYPRAGGYRFVGFDGVALVFHSGMGKPLRRLPQPVIPPLPRRAAA